MKELEQRLTELEIRSTHQERLIEDLNDIILDDNRRLSELSRQVQTLRQMLQGMGPELLASPDE
jgi:SlyX protein